MSTTRQHLIEAAEHLFATRGIDAVSLAEVTSAAGLNNTGAVHYHFGGREELLDAVVEEHRIELDRQRELHFDKLEAASDTSLTSLVRVLVEPLFAKLDNPRGRAFLSIQAQRMLRPRTPSEATRPLVLRFLWVLGTPQVSGPVAALLGDLMQILAFGALAQRARLESAAAAEGDTDGHGGRAGTLLPREVFAEQLVAALVRVLDAHTDQPPAS